LFIYNGLGIEVDLWKDCYTLGRLTYPHKNLSQTEILIRQRVGKLRQHELYVGYTKLMISLKLGKASSMIDDILHPVTRSDSSIFMLISAHEEFTHAND
jgi:hypothetical protein